MTFEVKEPDVYRGTKKEDLRISEVGRFNDHEEPMTVWSVHSGDEIPQNCKIPELNPPTSDQLPLSLRTERTSGGICRETNAVERILTWAEAVGYSLSDIDVVASRSAIRRLSNTPYQRHGNPTTPWSMELYRLQDTICIEMVQAHGVRQQYGPITSPEAAWAMVFEDMARTGGRGTPGFSCEDTNVRVPRLVELGSIRVLSSGKVHSQIMSGNERDVLPNYVEVKVWKKFYLNRNRPQHSRLFKETRIRDTWAQCALLGIPKVLLGERSNDGDLTGINLYSMEELEQNTEFWKPEEILSFINDFLTWVKANTKNGLCYSLKNDGRGNVHLELCENEEFARVVNASFPED